MFALITAKTRIHFTLHVLGNLMAAVAEDQVTKTKLILYQSIADVVQLTLTIFPLFIHQPGRMKINLVSRASPLPVPWKRRDPGNGF